MEHKAAVTILAATLALVSQTACQPTSSVHAAAAADITVPAGTQLRVRLDHAVSTARNRPGDHFTGSLANPVVVGGRTVLPSGARVSGIVRNSAPSGRLKGRAILSLRLSEIEAGGRHYQIATTSCSRSSAGHKKRNWLMAGGGTGAGALIGGLAAGGTGALIGAGAGAGAGVATAAITGKRQVAFPAESLLAFQTSQPFNVQQLKIQ